MMHLVLVLEHLARLLCECSCLPIQLQPWGSVQPLQCVRDKDLRELQHGRQGLLQRHLSHQLCPGHQCDVQLLWHLQLCRSWNQFLPDDGAPSTLACMTPQGYACSSINMLCMLQVPALAAPGMYWHAA